MCIYFIEEKLTEKSTIWDYNMKCGKKEKKRPKVGKNGNNNYGVCEYKKWKARFKSVFTVSKTTLFNDYR